MKFFVHTIGTSILNNFLRDLKLNIPNAGSILNEMTNFKEEKELSPIQKQVYNSLLDKDITTLDRKKYSAELNALYTYMDMKKNILDKQTDIHYLVFTDTLTGELSANYVKKMMQNDGFQQIELIRIPNLNTKGTESFNSGIKELFKWLDKTLNKKDPAIEVVFNLTGGFKSLQGYMNTAGMFYADKIIYIFESNTDIIEINKLPIVLDKTTIEPYAKEFLTAKVIGILPKVFLEKIEPIYKEEVDDLATLSPVGLLAWLHFEREILTEKLLKFNRLVYSQNFRDDFNDQKRDVVQLQEILAKVSYLLEENQGDIAILKRDGGLQYEDLKGKNSGIGHFRITQETRVSCTAENGQLVLRAFGAHDEVNNNP